MSILLDTGVLYAFLNRQDPRHGLAVSLLERIKSGEWGSPVVTEHVVDELFTLIRARKLSQAVEDAASHLLPLDGPSVIRLRIATVGPAGLAPAESVYRKHRDRGLSFTDASHLVLMERLQIETLATFDGGFKGLVPVVP